MIENKPELFRIGETYIKFNIDYSESNRYLIKEIYLKEVKELANNYLKHKELFKISIEYDKGSLKTRIVIWGTAMYLGIANYGSFRAGVRELINDSRFFSEFVIERYDRNPNIQPDNIIRTEKRNGLPGRVQEVYHRIDKLERNINELSNNQIQAELQEIKQEVSNIYAVLPNQDAQEFLNDLGQNYTQGLPNPDNRKVYYLSNRYGIKPDEEIEYLEE